MAALPSLRNNKDNPMSSTLRVLGCSGGIGADLRTTSFLLDHDVLIDAGTGVGDLTLDELKLIHQVFLTHSHLDHICSIPFMADAVGAARLASKSPPLKVYGIPETLDALKKHLFNDVIWPDFTKLPSVKNPFITLHPIAVGQTIDISKESQKRLITALPVDHSIPAVAYAIESDSGTLVFSGDTGSSVDFIKTVNQLPKLDHLIIETSFNDSEEALAKISGHLSPTLLGRELEQLNHPSAQVWITHLKPDGGQSIFDEITQSEMTGATSAIDQPKIKDLKRGIKISF
jgi:ribonuclease BN (tRNA processing enzyme)